MTKSEKEIKINIFYYLLITSFFYFIFTRDTLEIIYNL